MKPKIKVLQLIASLNHGGGETLALSLTEALLKLEMDIHLCAVGGKHVFGANTLYDRAKNLSGQVHFVRARNLWDITAIWKLKNYIQKEKFDLIHTHLADADIIGNLLGRLLGIPVVTTLHSVPHQYDISPKGRAWLMHTLVARGRTHLVAISDELRKQFITEWKVPENRITTIYNGIKMSDYLQIPVRANGNVSQNTYIISTIGRLDEVKAQCNLIDAVPSVLKVYSKSRFQLIGEGNLKNTLMEQAVRLGVDKSIDFLGRREDIPEILAQSDIFVLTSLWEGLPLSAIEAMAAGRPIILTDVGGNRELIIENEQGILVQPNDVSALAAAIAQLLSNQQLRLKMGRKSRERAVKHFDIKTVAKQYAKLYSNLA